MTWDPVSWVCTPRISQVPDFGVDPVHPFRVGTTKVKGGKKKDWYLSFKESVFGKNHGDKHFLISHKDLNLSIIKTIYKPLFLTIDYVRVIYSSISRTRLYLQFRLQHLGTPKIRGYRCPKNLQRGNLVCLSHRRGCAYDRVCCPSPSGFRRSLSSDPGSYLDPSEDSDRTPKTPTSSIWEVEGWGCVCVRGQNTGPDGDP